MNYPGIRSEGAILSPDILDGLYGDTIGQRPADFGLDSGSKVKDEIARAWADAQDYWRIFQRKLDTLKADIPATTEIRQCIYGVDLNPLAVELCKVALWLEAHNPGEPLNFLDHHIKCGNAIVGFARREELERGIHTTVWTQQRANGPLVQTCGRVSCMHWNARPARAWATPVTRCCSRSVPVRRYRCQE